MSEDLLDWKDELMINLGKKGRVHTRLEQGLMWLGLALCVVSLIWFTASSPGNRQGGWLITVAVLLLITVEISYRRRIKSTKSTESEAEPKRSTG